MKIDTGNLHVFKVTVPVDDVNDWLKDLGADLVGINSAIDNAAQWTNIMHDNAYVVIEIVRNKT